MRHRRHRPASRESEVKLHRGNGTLHAWVRFGAKLTVHCHDTQPTVSIPLGRWMKVQGQFEASTHVSSLISIHVGVGQCCRARAVEGDVEPPALPRNAFLLLGRWMQVQGKFKMQAHIISGVVMDVAAFKVGHSVGCDIDATALRAAERDQDL